MPTLENNKIERHHPFCNYWHTPPENCKYCKRLFKEYPFDFETQTIEDLIKSHFPNVIIRGEQNGKESESTN